MENEAIGSCLNGFNSHKMDVSDEISNVATAPKEPVMDPQAPSLNSPSGTLIDEKPSRGNKGRDGDGNGARRQEYRAQSNSRGHGKGGGRGASFSRNKRSDMGRAEWRYDFLILPHFLSN